MFDKIYIISPTMASASMKNDPFKDINKNPYDDTVASMLEGGGTPALGQSLLAVDGKKYTLKTNIGNEDGSDVYLQDTMVYK